MKNSSRAERRAAFINDIWSKQQNVVWPGPLRNSRSITELLWKGSPYLPLVQRIGLWLIGTCWFFLGVVGLIFTVETTSVQTRSWLEMFFWAVPVVVGVRSSPMASRKYRRTRSLW